MTARARLLFLGLIFLLLFPVIARSQEAVIVESKVGECRFSLEANDRWRTLRLRALHPQYHGCNIDQEAMLSALEAAFSKTEAPKLEGTYSSLSLGRLIDYPWMCQYLANAARHDRAWDLKKGRPGSMEINKYVADLLFQKELIGPLEPVLAKGGYRVVGVSVEKVLVGGAKEIPLYQGERFAGRVPFDAQVWLRLEKD